MRFNRFIGVSRHFICVSRHYKLASTKLSAAGAFFSVKKHVTRNVLGFYRDIYRKIYRKYSYKS